MNEITKARLSLKEALTDIENAGVRVATSAGDLNSQQYLVCVLVGPPSGEAEERLDELLAQSGTDSVKTALEAAPNVVVKKHSGYRLYPQAEGEQVLGSEWTVEVLF